MKPLIVLLGTSAISFLILRMFQGVLEPALSARIGMAAMLLFTAIGHFKFTKGQVNILSLYQCLSCSDRSIQVLI